MEMLLKYFDIKDNSRIVAHAYCEVYYFGKILHSR